MDDVQAMFESMDQARPGENPPVSTSQRQHAH
jgi:hypothetical protein